MTIWRPPPSIRVKALGLHWRDNRLLAAEVLDDAGRVKGVRPLGGTVEFGETAEAAVIRKFQEELGVAVKTVGQPFFMEHLYTHEGSFGHELIILFAVMFPWRAFASEDRLQFREDIGVTGFAEWLPLTNLVVPVGPSFILLA